MFTLAQIELQQQYTLDSLRWQHRSALTNAHETSLPCLKAFWLAVAATNRRAIAHYKGK